MSLMNLDAFCFFLGIYVFLSKILCLSVDNLFVFMSNQLCLSVNNLMSLCPPQNRPNCHAISPILLTNFAEIALQKDMFKSIENTKT